MFAYCTANYARLVAERTIYKRVVRRLSLSNASLATRSSTKWFAPEAVTCPATREVEQLPTIKHDVPDTHGNVVTSTDEWHFVERLFPHTVKQIPNVTPGEVTPAGYVAPFAKLGDHPYFVGRTSNFMPRVHLRHLKLYNKYYTIVSGIEGDVFQLADDLKHYLIELYDKQHIIMVYVLEPHQKIFIRKDFVNDVKKFLLEKGF